MAVYEITDKQGQVFEIEGPDTASDSDILAVLQQQGIQTSGSNEMALGSSPGPSEEVLNLRNQIAALEAQHTDPVVISAQKARLGYLERGETPPFPLRSVQQSADIAGEKTTEFLGSKGVPAPISAGVGTLVQMAPDIAMSIPFGGRAVAAAPEIANVGARVATKAVSPFRRTADLFFGPGREAAELKGQALLEPVEQKLLQLQENLTNIPTKIGEKRNLLMTLKREAGEAISKAEEAAGFALTRLPDDALKFLAKQPEEFGALMAKVAKTSPEELLKTYGPNGLQLLRKMGQEFRHVGGKATSTAEAHIGKGREAAAKALELVDEGFKAARKRWQELDDVLKHLPEEARTTRTQMTVAVQKTRAALKDIKDEIRILRQRGAKRDTARQYAMGALGLTGLGGFLMR